MLLVVGLVVFGNNYRDDDIVFVISFNFFVIGCCFKIYCMF